MEKRSKKDSQASYAVGLLSLQLEDYPSAQAAFDRALKENYREPTAVYLGLGQAAEGLKQYDEAIRWYQKVESGDWIRAQLKIATLIARTQGLVGTESAADEIRAMGRRAIAVKCDVTDRDQDPGSAAREREEENLRFVRGRT